MKRYCVFRISVLIATTFALWACQQKPPGGDAGVSSNSAEDRHEITVGYSRLRISLPVFVAKERGFFEKHGLDATLLMYDTAQPLMQALVEKRIEIAGYTALPITFNGMLRSKTDLLFLTTMIEDQECRISYLLRPVPAGDQEPTIKSIKDLKDKSIGILPTIAYKAWIEAILVKNGLNPETDVQIRPIAPALQAQSLANGAVDALFTNDPAATSAIQAGIAELIDDSKVEVPASIISPFPFGSFNVLKEWAENNTEAYRNLTKALNEAVTYVNNNPVEAKQAMKPYLPDTFREHVDSYPDACYLRTNESSAAQFQGIADMYLEMGIIPSAIDVSGLVETKEY